MSDTTTAPAATPEAQAADGQQMEPEQTNSEHAQALPLSNYAPSWKPPARRPPAIARSCDRRRKAKTDAERQSLAEQGKYRTLYESVKAKADAADALQERLDAITAQAQAANERRIAAIPDTMRSLVPEYDDPLKLAAWLDANAAVFSRPTPPPLDGRAGGNGTPAMVTDAEVLDFATRMRIDPAHVDRAKLAKLKR
jgi:hypothetical protein